MLFPVFFPNCLMLLENTSLFVLLMLWYCPLQPSKAFVAGCMLCLEYCSKIQGNSTTKGILVHPSKPNAALHGCKQKRHASVKKIIFTFECLCWCSLYIGENTWFKSKQTVVMLAFLLFGHFHSQHSPSIPSQYMTMSWYLVEPRKWVHSGLHNNATCRDAVLGLWFFNERCLKPQLQSHHPSPHYRTHGNPREIAISQGWVFPTVVFAPHS